MRKKLIKIIIVLILSVTLYYLYHNVLYKASRNINLEPPAYQLLAEKLADEYNTDTQKADSKYLNKTIEVKGKVTEVNDSVLVLNEKIFCKMNDKVNEILTNRQIIIKGRCIGYDDLFEEVKLDQCSN